MITITNEDNMNLMARYPDKYFDLAIVISNYFHTFDVNKNYDKRFKTTANRQSRRVFSLC